MALLPKHTSKNFLNGQLLVAMPQMQDHRFNHAVIYICGHDDNGAMGLVINKLIDDIYLSDLLVQLGINTNEFSSKIPINFGGPIEMGRGFILHTPDYMQEGSTLLSPDIALTVTLDILEVIVKGGGPSRQICALGYAGWSSGQLEKELRDNLWLQMPPDTDIIFNEPVANRWKKSMLSIGVEPENLSWNCGHA